MNIATNPRRRALPHRGVLAMPFGGAPERTRENIARLGADVLPRLRARFDDQ